MQQNYFTPCGRRARTQPSNPMDIEAIISDGPRAYANWTQADIDRELHEYHQWLDEQAEEARRQMDGDTEYIKSQENR